jgi:divalent metal cation (Fe/Co/Zn/Cd) transporter
MPIDSRFPHRPLWKRPPCSALEGRGLQGAVAAPVSEPRLWRWAWGLTALTVGWNALEALVALVSGLLAGSIALVGFGLDSVVEVSSALVIGWRLTRQSADPAANQRAERRAVRLIALTFFAIAAYVTYEALGKLLGWTEAPSYSPVGLVLVALSLVVMPALAWAKRRVAAGLGSVALRADAAETQLCTYLSAVVLVGLAANGLFGWWWMDPLAGLVVAAVALREGRAAWASGAHCC